MTLFNKVKFLPYSSLPDTTAANEMYAVPFNMSVRTAPNYAAKRELSTNTSYTVGSGALAGYSQGYFLAGCTTCSDETDPSITFNGYTAILMGSDRDYGGDLSGYCIFIPAKTGDTFYIYRENGGGTQRVWFIPAQQ